MIRFNFLWIILILQINAHSAEFFPTDERYLMQLLNLKQRDWTRDGITTHVELLEDEKILIKVVVPSSVYLFQKDWRLHVQAFIRSISSKVNKTIRRYASEEFLSVFEPRLDIRWDIYLHNTLYGRLHAGKLGFKRGLY
tara:strand:+ start:661 stop:1077 length:417 start_codon:yes stop_codon:yes gene_type:complete